jgi:hypothetical protein
MRKTLRSCLSFIGLASLLFMQPVLAQNSSPYWSLAGNSNATSSSKLGTTNAINLRLFTSNVERVRITTSGLVGIGTTAPNARLHFNTPTGTSLLRGTVNGSTKLYMSSAGGLTIGSGTAAPANGLYVAGKVGIGTATPSYKLQVEGGSGVAVYGNSSNNYGVFGNSVTTGVYGQGGTTGVYGYAPGGTGYGNGVSGQSSYIGVNGYGGSYGVYGTSYNSSGGFGVYGSGNTSSGTGVYGTGYYGVRGISNTLYGVDGTGYYVGVVGHGSNSNSFSYGTEGYGVYQGGYFTGSHIGVQGYATGSGGSNYGVYGSAGSGAYAGYFNGPVFATSYSGSDRKLKKNIEDVSTAMDIINQLHPKTYEFRQDGNYKFMHLPEGKHYGLIAQDVEQVLPNLVKETKFDTRVEQLAQAKAASGGTLDPSKPMPSSEVVDFKAVNYTELIPILIKALQEQEQKINTLQAMVDKLVQEKGTNAVTGLGTLSQNTPNPAHKNTRITYSLPTATKQAHLLITDAAGKTVKTLQLSTSGVVDLNTSTLSSGLYNYSLVINGQVVDTRKMIIAR